SRLFIDGVEQVLSLRQGTPLVRSAATAGVLGGVDPSLNTGFKFHGRLDELAVYTGQLSPDRIAAHYQAGKNPIQGLAVYQGALIDNVAPSVTITGAPTTSLEGTQINLSSAFTVQLPIANMASAFSSNWSVTKNGVAYATGTPTNAASFSFTPDDN